MNIKKDLMETIEKFPKLKNPIDSKKYNLIGEIDIFDNKGVYWDSFNIEIGIFKNYPYSFPIVYLLDDKIPLIEDRHMNSDRSCCVEVKHKTILRAKRGISILQFMNEYVVPFFSNQLYFEKHKDWANGEYLHRGAGIVQFYFEELKLKDLNTFVFILENLKSFKRNDICFCKSKLKYKKCHQEKLQNILSLPKEVIRKDVEFFKSLVKLNEKIK